MFDLADEGPTISEGRGEAETPERILSFVGNSQTRGVLMVPDVARLCMLIVGAVDSIFVRRLVRELAKLGVATLRLEESHSSAARSLPAPHACSYAEEALSAARTATRGGGIALLCFGATSLPSLCNASDMRQLKGVAVLDVGSTQSEARLSSPHSPRSLARAALDWVRAAIRPSVSSVPAPLLRVLEAQIELLLISKRGRAACDWIRPLRQHARGTGKPQFTSELLDDRSNAAMVP